MVIYLGCSLDDIFFGLAISDVIQLLGNPNKINEDEREGFIVYYYNKKMAKFYFSLEDHNKLYTIEVFHPDTYLWNQKVIGMRMSEIEELLKENSLYTEGVEDYDYFEAIFCREIWSVFCFEYDRLKSIEFSVLCDENNNLIWPKKRLKFHAF